ncbi:Peptidase S24-like family protein [Neisseria animaloris]|uniref:LexA family transcriptional regulator n=1 Tax=Neisseria animaloris TaxID=326522 RepID=UPI000A1959F8|nr:LexA family transcriptional regulator [Neisseria animaloris]OSI06809.1 hypothetical protein BWD08_10630 [Neisseria animaloris]VEH86543.1 Peptidase S24-like family protein [Neisseria animaloris]
MNHLSQNLKYLFRKHNTNATQLSELIPVSQPTLNRIEKGKTKNPQIDNLNSIANYFGVTVYQLVNTSIEDTDNGHPQTNKTSTAGMCESPRRITTKTSVMPLLEIEQALEFVEKPEILKTVNCEKIATSTKHSQNAFAIRMFDNSMRAIEEVEESFNKNDILIAEPQIKPRHEDIVVVNLNPGKKIGIIAKLEIDPFGGYRLRRTGINIVGENPMEMPEGSYICAVITEVKRRILSPDSIETRMNKNYNPLSSTINKHVNQ